MVQRWQRCAIPLPVVAMKFPANVHTGTVWTSNVLPTMRKRIESVEVLTNLCNAVLCVLMMCAADILVVYHKMLFLEEI